MSFHNGRTAYPNVAERFWVKVDKTQGCWLWTAPTNKRGYGQLKLEGKMRKAHRVAWELVGNTLRLDQELDHGCENPSCVKPHHLEQVPHRTNVLRGRGVAAINARKTHCPKGHSYSPENTYIAAGKRFCRLCNGYKIGSQ